MSTVTSAKFDHLKASRHAGELQVLAVQTSAMKMNLTDHGCYNNHCNWMAPSTDNTVDSSGSQKNHGHASCMSRYIALDPLQNSKKHNQSTWPSSCTCFHR